MDNLNINLPLPLPLPLRHLKCVVEGKISLMLRGIFLIYTPTSSSKYVFLYLTTSVLNDILLYF